MTSKQGLGLGLLCGIAAGTVACVAVVFWSGQQLKDAQKDAYERGILDASKASQNTEPISLQLNAAMLKENGELHEALKAAREKLEPVAKRTDLPAEARQAVEEAIEALK
ncbi:MAG: hypothetical protein KF696_12150 [Planctomycetes bacterium]|nr:hypothetical protein [Planctomycetota bacterium]MCW8136552.1 hypothetical protein [Planctomycetota bacterium]